MKIRSITTLLNPGWPLDETLIEKAGAFIASARPAIEAAGYEVQTTRLATPPFSQLVPECRPDDVIDFAQAVERAAKAQGYDYISIGPALPAVPQSYAVLPDVFAATGVVFAAGIMSSTRKGVSLPAVRACADVIHRSAGLAPNGFSNLFFAALANVAPGGPFLPAAYHDSGPPKFALATESAGLAVEAFTSAASLAEARQNLIASIETHAENLARVANSLSTQHEIRFTGLDFTPAPFPSASLSIGTALERLGLPAFGMHGSLAAAAFLVDTLDLANFPRAGFNGLLLPVLEDAALAARAAEGVLTVTDLLLCSAVCGTGLDTVPLPGDTTPDQLAAILLDVASLAQRLDKPLTARLMPIPGKSAGDPIEFDFPYFANSRVMGLRAAPLTGKLAGDEHFHLRHNTGS
ncbi:MAG: DUF711 family protein [Anaerolineales bacterium]